MNAVERLTAAIRRLEKVKSTIGFVAVGEDPTELYVRVEEDDDGDTRFAYGLSVGGGVDADEEINDAFALLARTVDAQLEILRRGQLVAVEGSLAVQLADAILGDAS